MTTTVDGLRLRAIMGRDQWMPPVPFGPDGWHLTHRNVSGSVIVTTARQDDGHDWTHASIAYSDRMPTYFDLVQLHTAVYADGWAYQVFAPRAAHVNIHPYALHLWGRVDGTNALPAFAREGSI